MERMSETKDNQSEMPDLVEVVVKTKEHREEFVYVRKHQDTC
jgi:hypothetical protein